MELVFARLGHERLGLNSLYMESSMADWALVYPLIRRSWKGGWGVITTFSGGIGTESEVEFNQENTDWALVYTIIRRSCVCVLGGGGGGEITTFFGGSILNLRRQLGMSPILWAKVS